MSFDNNIETGRLKGNKNLGSWWGNKDKIKTVKNTWRAEYFIILFPIKIVLNLKRLRNIKGVNNKGKFIIKWNQNGWSPWFFKLETFELYKKLFSGANWIFWKRESKERLKPFLWRKYKVSKIIIKVEHKTKETLPRNKCLKTSLTKQKDEKLSYFFFCFSRQLTIMLCKYSKQGKKEKIGKVILTKKPKLTTNETKKVLLSEVFLENNKIRRLKWYFSTVLL